MNDINAIIFDYDGIISESVNVKTKAFAKLYSKFGDEVVNKVINHHENNGGISRFEKFKFYHENFLNIKIDKMQIDKLSLEFSSIVLEKVINSPYVNGAELFIKNNYTKYDFHISTGTPEEEIQVILNRKKIRKYFKTVHGSPEKKYNHVSKILTENKYNPNNVVFIGDALSDRDAARKNKINFIGRYTTSKEIKNEKYLIENFNDLDKLLL